MYVCMYVCVFAIGAKTVGPIGLKFGTEVRFHPGSVLGYVRVGYPHPPGRGRPRSGPRVLLEVLQPQPCISGKTL